jgi:hypothetical protein
MSEPTEIETRQKPRDGGSHWHTGEHLTTTDSRALRADLEAVKADLAELRRTRSGGKR